MTRALIGIAVCLLAPVQAIAIDFADDFQSGTLNAWECNPCEDWSVSCANSEGTALVIQLFQPALLSASAALNGLIFSLMWISAV